MRFLLAASLVALVAAESKTPVHGSKCAPNQVINRLTVYEDGAIEAECGPLPCGYSGQKCSDAAVACKGDTDIFSGMSWAPNGQSVLLRCCSLNVPKKIYVGTDLVTAGSFYVGGAISEKDKYGSGGAEYDFITNIRTEQGGVRVWVYRVMCDAPAPARSAAAAPRPQQQPRPAPAAAAAPVPVAHVDDRAAEDERLEKRRRYLLEKLSGKPQQAQSEEVEEEGDEEEYEDEEEAPASTFNPLRYRPAVRGNKAPRV